VDLPLYVFDESVEPGVYHFIVGTVKRSKETKKILTIGRGNKRI